MVRRGPVIHTVGACSATLQIGLRNTYPAVNSFSIEHGTVNFWFHFLFTRTQRINLKPHHVPQQLDTNPIAITTTDYPYLPEILYPLIPRKSTRASIAILRSTFFNRRTGTRLLPLAQYPPAVHDTPSCISKILAQHSPYARVDRSKEDGRLGGRAINQKARGWVTSVRLLVAIHVYGHGYCGDYRRERHRFLGRHLREVCR